MSAAALFLIAASMIDVSNTARILGIIPTPSYSHQIVYRPIWKNLSLRGHQVTVITTDPMRDPDLTNLTEIDIHFSYKHFSYVMAQITSVDQGTNSILRYFKIFFNFLDMLIVMTREQLDYPPVQALLKDEIQKFDLLMVEAVNPVMLAFGKRFGCPIIGLFSLDGTTSMHEAVGNPINPALYPDVSLAFEGRLTFFERLQSSAYVVALKLMEKWLDWMCAPLLQEYFGEQIMMYAMMSSIDMLFLNANPALDSLRPSVPSVIYIGGGAHLEAPKELPEEIKDYLDGAENGLIYFSLGTNIKSKNIPDGLRQIIVETLSELPYKILWKFEADELPGKPPNVKIMQWLPQQDILRHPNVKLFITQGGLQSLEEAIFSHVPLVVMPFMGDQETNAKKIAYRGYGLSVDRRTLTKETFKKTILEVIDNEEFRNRLKEVAELAADQPMTGIDSAIWWTEYVLRHKGAKHLRSPSVDIPWYQYLLLDVIAFILFVVVLAIFIVNKVLKAVFSLARYLIAKTKLKTN